MLTDAIHKRVIQINEIMQILMPSIMTQRHMKMSREARFEKKDVNFFFYYLFSLKTIKALQNFSNNIIIDADKWGSMIDKILRSDDIYL